MRSAKSQKNIKTPSFCAIAKYNLLSYILFHNIRQDIGSPMRPNQRFFAQGQSLPIVLAP